MVQVVDGEIRRKANTSSRVEIWHTIVLEGGAWDDRSMQNDYY